MSDASAAFLFDDFGLLRFSGADARKFLQGQLSNDVQQLTRAAVQWSGLHNPQGRTLAVLWLLARADDEVFAALPSELTATTLGLLRRYLLRSKLVIEDASSTHALVGVFDEADAAVGYRFGDGRHLQLLNTAPTVAANAALRARWRSLDVAAGLPQIYSATSGEFVAQMLNLDCIGGISFTKGCYTGQEVIARAHYRGRVKRRMQRFLSSDVAMLNPGESRQLGDGRSIKVVEVTARSDGRSEFLAVAPLAAAAEAPIMESVAMLACEPLSLPYPLPD